MNERCDYCGKYVKKVEQNKRCTDCNNQFKDVLNKISKRYPEAIKNVNNR